MSSDPEQWYWETWERVDELTADIAKEAERLWVVEDINVRHAIRTRIAQLREKKAALVSWLENPMRYE